MINCTNCGKPLLDDMRFCPYCGQVVALDDAERFDPVKGEVVTAVASPARIVGREGDFALAFTPEQVIFVRIECCEVDRQKDELLQAGIFLPGSSSSSNVSRFYEMTPDQVLGESQGNFSLRNEDVDSVRLSYESEGTGRYAVSLIIGGERMNFTLPYDKYYRDLLFRAFEGKVTW